MKNIPYNPVLKNIASKLRNNATWGERKLWQKLRKKQLGYDFNRQKPLLDFIVDFYCSSIKLAIEIDGASHDEIKYDLDIKRQKKLEEYGIKFLRFTEFQVKRDLNSVLETISLTCSKLSTKHPPASTAKQSFAGRPTPS